MLQQRDSAVTSAAERRGLMERECLSREIRRRYHRLFKYHVRRAQRWYPDLTEEDLSQEIELAISSALRAWNRRRAPRMQYSTYLHWHLAKRLTRLGLSPLEILASDHDLTETL